MTFPWASSLSRLDDVSMAHVPIGVFRSVDRPTYGRPVRDQVGGAVAEAGGPVADEDLARLIAGSDTWTVA